MRAGNRIGVACLFGVIALCQMIGCDFEAPQKSYQEYLARGILLYTRGDVEGAIENFVKAAALNPNSADVYFHWGNAVGTRMPDDAVDKYRKALELNPRFGLVYLQWGNLLKYQGKLDEAIDKYRKLSELSPKSYVAYKFWGDVLKQQGKSKEAEKMFRKASEVDPTIHRR